MDVRIRDWTFTHWWVRPTVKIWFDFYHKSVTYSGTEHLDWSSPLIFAPSHQNAFTDALCLILPTKYTNDRFIYPLIRADAFGNNRALDWMLTVFHMLPVYRPRDGVNLKQRNDSVFSHCHQILFQNRNLLIHPAGNCIPKKRVEPFKKGLARIALGAEAEKDFSLGTKVVPVGINYRNITEARKGIHIRFGPPVSVSDYREEYHNSSAKSINHLTQAVECSVRDVTVDITSNDYQRTEKLVQLLKTNAAEINTRSSYSSEEVDFEQSTIANLRHGEQHQQDFSDEVYQLLDEITAEIEGHNLSKELPLRTMKTTGRLLLDGVLYVAVLPIVIFGWINNLIPWTAMNKVGDMINDTQFKNSARMVAGLLIFPFAYALQTAVIGLSWNWETALLYLLLLPLTGIFTLNTWENSRHWIQQIRLKQLSNQEYQKISGLLNTIAENVNSAPDVTSSDSAEP
jgi:1-acyl-sn-glycerol-3-phosphate acyltransferase